MLLLDTNVVSELRKVRAGKADANVSRWAERVVPSQLYLSVITLHELELGVLLAERRDPGGPLEEAGPGCGSTDGKGRRRAGDGHARSLDRPSRIRAIVRP